MLNIAAVLPILLLLYSGWVGSFPIMNNPYQDRPGQSLLYSSFSERPKHLDPARSYSSNEYNILGQVYEPVLQYHYLKRPYTLEPLTAVRMPEISYMDSSGNPTSKEYAHSVVYTIRLKPGISYYPHPALARDNGDYIYLNLGENHLSGIKRINDFKESGTKLLSADDYIYQMKRLADPANFSPISALLSKHIVGFEQLRADIRKAREDMQGDRWLDLRDFSFSGVKQIDSLTYSITVLAGYPQFIYWLAMPFFCPLPWQADAFYRQPHLQRLNISLDWHPIGTGPFTLIENNPNFRMTLQRNPYYREDYYPDHGQEGDLAKGLLADKGKQLPLLDAAIYSLEKEDISHWNKFLQGYYDTAGISSDSFDSSIQVSAHGEFGLTDDMREKAIDLVTSLQTSIVYIGFNMLDEVIGGQSEGARKLRRAISIALDMEEYISIFLNGRGTPAQGPVPQGIFGHQEGIGGYNSFVYKWQNGRAVRRSIDEARILLSEAGYPNGIDPKTNKPLSLFFDTAALGPDAKSWLNWLRKQFDKLGIQLLVRSSDYNRFQEKMLNGKAQIFRWGWNADYPDPENFLFLFYGPNGKVLHGGENASNYSSSRFDLWFEEMRGMQNTAARQELISKMVDLLRDDGPWIWGYYPKSFGLYHSWVYNLQPNLMAHNTLKYLRINDEERVRWRQSWNQPHWFPMIVIAVVLAIIVTPAVFIWKKRLHASAFENGGI